MTYSYYGTKAVIVGAFLKFVDWKKPMPMLKREVPCAILAFGLCGLADYLAYLYAFGRT